MHEREPITTGNAQVTIIFSGPCPGEITENVEFELMSGLSNFDDVREFQLLFGRAEDAGFVRLKTSNDGRGDCGVGNRFSYAHAIFWDIDPIYIKPEDGAVYEAVYQGRHDNLVEVRVEIHKVK